jgi:hypothetical protein
MDKLSQPHVLHHIEELIEDRRWFGSAARTPASTHPSEFRNLPGFRNVRAVGRSASAVYPDDFVQTGLLFRRHPSIVKRSPVAQTPCFQ